MSRSNQEIADQLYAAAKSKEYLDPIRDELGIKNIEAAYEIQKINIDRRIKEGARIVGKKVGLTSKVVQKQLGVDEPDYGILLDTMEVNDGNLSIDELNQAKIEAEIGFVLSRDISGDSITASELLYTIDYAVACIEIVGSRIRDWNIKLVDTVADNASASHFIIGHLPKRVTDFDMVNCKMEIYKNNELASSGSGKDCLGSPLVALHWLVNKWLSMGVELKAGELIITGALGPMVPAEQGDSFEARIEGLGSVHLNIV